MNAGDKYEFPFASRSDFVFDMNWLVTVSVDLLDVWGVGGVYKKVDNRCFTLAAPALTINLI